LVTKNKRQIEFLSSMMKGPLQYLMWCGTAQGRYRGEDLGKLPVEDKEMEITSFFQIKQDLSI
jgi:hypothetical protein